MRDMLIIIKELCCQNRKEEKKLVDFSFILLQGFRELASVKQIDCYNFNDPDLRITDNMNELAVMEAFTMKYDIIKKIS